MSIDSHCDAFELSKNRGIQNREHLLRKKAGDALKREAKAAKQAKKVAAREKALRKDAKKKSTTLEDFMPPQSAANDDFTKYLNAPQITVEPKEDCGEKSEEISEDEDDCVLVDDLERGFDMESPEEGWALL